MKNPKTKQPAKPLPKQIEKPKPRSDKVVPPGKSYESLIGRTKSVKDIEEYPRCPWRFYVRGRLSGYWPLNLADFVVLHCNKCNETYVCIIFPMRSNIHILVPSFSLAGHLKECPKCMEDMSDSSVQPRYRFFLEIEDEDGDRIKVSVSKNDVSIRCVHI